MRILATFLLLLSSVLGAAPALAAPADLSAMLDKIRVQYKLPALAAAVVSNGELVAVGAVGTRLYGQEIPVTVNDRFHLGSDTKAMTATIAGTLVDEKKLRWDSTVGEVLGAKVPGMSKQLQAVTLEQLLSHTSGIPTDTPEMLKLYFNAEGFEYEPDVWRVRALDAWKHNVPVVPKGSPFQYSNFGYMIAGMMVETAAGKPWEQLIQERIFQPLGLTTAGLGPQATYGLYDAPIGNKVDDNGKVTPMPWGPAAAVPPLIAPAGNAHMSIIDFARWGGWNALGGRAEPHIVTPETLAEIHRPRVEIHIPNPRPGTPGDGQYAFGWGIVKFDWADHPMLTHDGSNDMNLARITVDTRSGFAIATTTNFPTQTASDALGAVTKALYQIYGAPPAKAGQ